MAYALATTGATRYVHFCMDQLVNAGVGTNDAPACHNCGMTKQQQQKSDCCKDNVNLLKMESDQLNASSFDFNLNIQTTPSLPAYTDIIPFRFSQQLFSAGVDVPPVIPGIPIFLNYCSFRIWYPAH